MYLHFFFCIVEQFFFSYFWYEKIASSIYNANGNSSYHTFRSNRPMCRTLIQFYLYSDSNRSVIRTFSAFASSSILSSVGECFSFMISLIVDLGTPDIIESCRTEMFLLYMISSNNIFMLLFLAKAFILYRYFFYQLDRKIKNQNTKQEKTNE